MDQPRWLELAWGDLGIAETPGAADNPRVVRYFAEVHQSGIAHDAVAWCAAFVGACLERASIRSTRSLMARSYLAWGVPAEEARLGAVAVLSRGFDPRLGHVGFLVGETSAGLILLGGNQSGRVCVEAFPRNRLLALRWPVIGAAPPVPADAPAADPAFERALAHVLEMEGGATDDPYDPGGPTNFGITLATYAEDKGVRITAANLAILKAELAAITPATVRRIYYRRYWLPAHCPDLPPPLAFFHFDAAVNQGVTGAARMLQEAAGTFIDGEIGPLTLAATAARSLAQLLADYAEVRRRHYRALPHFWRFGRGWLNRVDRALARARALNPISPPPVAPQPKENPPMASATDPTVTTAAAAAPGPAATSAPDTKWWGQSMTIWGVIITALSTVLPALGPLIGLDITADIVHQLGDQVVLVVQALGGLIGTILSIYGRTRATALLSRRTFTMNL
jgi:uncharacterized protein (TIGR02594 family)